jgi:NADH-quinone oxidoreductase subunit C
VNLSKTDRDQIVTGALTSQFGSAIEKYEVLDDILCVTVSKDIIKHLMLFLRDNATLKFNFLTTLCGMHYPERNNLGVVYHLHSFSNNHRIRIKTETPVEHPSIPSITSIWPAANWQERETYDFYGIIFEGHPNLKRILNVDEMTDFPLRKEFPLEDQTRHDKDDSMFGR